MREELFEFGDKIQAFGMIPAFIVALDYGLIRPVIRRGRHFTPWFRSGAGIMIFLLAFSLFVGQLVVALSLQFGPLFPGREYVRIIGYLLVGLSAYFMLGYYLWANYRPSARRAARAHTDALDEAEDQSGK